MAKFRCLTKSMISSKYSTIKMYPVIIQKFEQFGLTIEYCIQKME